MLHAWMSKAILLNMLSRRNVKMAIEKNLHSQFWHCCTVTVKDCAMWFYFWWSFCCCFWGFFAVSSKNGHLQWTGLRALWAALSRVVFVPCYQQHKLIYYRDMLRSTLPLWEKTPDLAAVKPPHLTFGFKQNQLCSKTRYSLKGFSTSRFSTNFSDTLSQFECLVAQHFKQFCHGMHPV